MIFEQNEATIPFDFNIKTLRERNPPTFEENQVLVCSSQFWKHAKAK